jgi:hypothetical protein
MEGRVIIKRNGEVVAEKENLIVNSGVEQLAKLINGESTVSFNYMGIGTSATAPSSTQTSLGSQVAIVKTTNSLATTRVSNDTCLFQATFSFSTSYALTEIGLFTSSTSGIMLNRTLIGTVNVSSGIDVSVLWQVVV